MTTLRRIERRDRSELYGRCVCGGYPTRVFCGKSVDLLDYTGVEFFRGDKESVIVSKLEGYDWNGGGRQRGLFEVTYKRGPRIGTYVNSKLVSTMS
jgi:hypothetical protein